MPTELRDSHGRDYTEVAGTHYGGLDAPSPVSGKVILNSEGIRFVWSDFTTPRKKEFAADITSDEIARTDTDTDRRPSVGATVAFGVMGLAASKATAGLIVQTVDGRTVALGLKRMTSPELIGLLSRYGLYRRGGSD